MISTQQIFYRVRLQRSTVYRRSPGELVCPSTTVESSAGGRNYDLQASSSIFEFGAVRSSCFTCLQVATGGLNAWRRFCQSTPVRLRLLGRQACSTLKRVGCTVRARGLRILNAETAGRTESFSDFRECVYAQWLRQSTRPWPLAYVLLIPRVCRLHAKFSVSRRNVRGTAMACHERRVSLQNVEVVRRLGPRYTPCARNGNRNQGVTVKTGSR